MKKILLAILILQAFVVNSQNSWEKVFFKQTNKTLKNKTTVSKSEELDLYKVDMLSFKDAMKSNKEIILPNFNGSFSSYYITENSNFTNNIATAYDDIKSYSLKNKDDHTSTGKISIGTDGIHVIIFSGEHKTLFIDPYEKENNTYAVHTKNELNSEEHNFSCLVEDNLNLAKNSLEEISHKTTNDGTLKTYRLALASTGEYSQFHINQQGISSNASNTVKEAAVLSAMNTTITRVNAVFERDLSVHLNIVLNANGTNDLIFLDEDQDDFSNGDAGQLIEESQIVCDNIIGTNNYDIGHTFSTGGGGLAGLGVICSSRSKGKGVTGSSSPIGDSFDIDFVAHEIGHQFGANHTFNGSSEFNCDDANRNNATAVEPASGTTIMSYAGICPGINIQNNVDDYFHAVSIAEMQNTIDRTSCAIETNTGNLAPVITINKNYSVPTSTPLILKGVATDNESNNLTYCWEQIDNELVIEPLSTNTAGPAFRSFAPTSSPNRYLPTLQTVVSGNLTNDYEAIPEVAREMNFSLTVRDNQINGGATAREDIVVNFINTNPFTVNTPNNLAANSNEQITWNTGNTNVSPINATKVTIKLSVDGGQTFPITIIENTDNDGSENVQIPSIATTDNAILLVEATDNIFYNISNTFEITNNTEISLTNTTENVSVCNDGEISFAINYAPINDFSETINFSITDKPEEAIVSLSTNSLNDSGQLIVTASNLANLTNGEYFITLNASAPSIIQNLTLPFQKISDHCTSVGNTADQTSITEVNFNTISNTSAKATSGYTDFKSVSTTLNIGDTHNLSVNVDTDGFFLTETVAWIDWNQNCTFDDNEKYNLGEAFNIVNGTPANSPIAITVPEDAIAGNTVMRILIRYTGDGSEISSACDNNFFGETEDYTIIINDPTATVNNNDFNNFNVYPNPSQGLFKVNFDVYAQNEKIIVQLFDINGRRISIKEYQNTNAVFSEQLNFKNLNSGLYLLHIINGNKLITTKIVIE